jgi:glycosyltransferase involved in cell wall biosynthesis
MENAMAVVAPSLWPETGPLVVAEAMANGVPAIVSSRAGAAGRVRHGVNGFVVEPEAGAIATAIAALRKASTAEELGAHAYADFWADPPSRAAHAIKLIAIYRDAVRQ